MKRLLTLLWLTASLAYAQDQSTPNLITSGTTHTWTGVATGSMAMSCPPGGGACSGGPGAMYDPNTNTIHFSYGQAVAAQTFAVNQALANAGTGIQVRGYSYSWDINNNNYDGRQGSTDTLTATVQTLNYDNSAVRRTDTWVYNTKFDWTTFSGDVNYVNPGLPSDFGNLTVSFSGRDTGFWGGFYGPQVRNVSLKMRYGVDACLSDPLSSPTCPGYAAAYLTQQCTANALYDPSCPGYAAAYLTQQCTINSLYSPSCPGYRQAYFTQQCNLDGLYSTQCPNYSEAYAKKMLLEKQGIAETVQAAGTVASIAANDPVAQATEPVTSVSPAAAATATVPLVKAEPPAATPVTQAPAPATVSAPQQEQKQEGPKTARQELQAKRQEAAKRDAVAKGKNLANEMGKAASMEQQVQVQNVVMQAMGYTPGFDAYGKAVVPDAAGYRPYTVYNNQRTVDNRRLGWGLFGPTDKVHSEMVDSQFKGN